MIRVLRALSRLGLFWPMLFFVTSTIALMFWEIGRLASGPDGQPWGRWSRVVPRVAVVTTVITVFLIALRFAHIAKVF